MDKDHFLQFSGATLRFIWIKRVLMWGWTLANCHFLRSARASTFNLHRFLCVMIFTSTVFCTCTPSTKLVYFANYLHDDINITPKSPVWLSPGNTAWGASNSENAPFQSWYIQSACHWSPSDLLLTVISTRMSASSPVCNGHENSMEGLSPGLDTVSVPDDEVSINIKRSRSHIII